MKPKKPKTENRKQENKTLNHQTEARETPGKVKCYQSLVKVQPCSQLVFDIAEGSVLITFNKIQSKDDCLGSLSNKVLSLITILYYQ